MKYMYSPLDWGRIYPYLGLIARGRFDKMVILKHYWYGQRIDRYTKPYDTINPKRLGLRADTARMSYLFHYMSEPWQAEYRRQAEYTKVNGSGRFYKLYAAARKSWADPNVTWSDPDWAWTRI